MLALHDIQILDAIDEHPRVTLIALRTFFRQGASISLYLGWTKLACSMSKLGDV